MVLPAQLNKHKDKIIVISMLAGGAFAAAYKFDLASAAVLKDWVPYVEMGAAIFGVWVFNEGFLKLRKLRMQQQQQGMRPQMQPRMEPTPADLVTVQFPQQPMMQQPPIQPMQQPQYYQQPPYQPQYQQPYPQQMPPQPAPKLTRESGIPQPPVEGEDIFAGFQQ